jgi:hypothetical protein
MIVNTPHNPAVDLPGFLRISLTANDEMIDRALPEFAAAMKEVATKAR